MAIRRIELDDLVNRPGTYFNPQTEIVLIVDDSSQLDTEIIEDDLEGAEWVQISDELPVDEHRRDELLEKFAVRLHGAAELEEEPEEEELEPDEEE